MPWTLAHPAAVLPLAPWLVPGALVAGALAPDVWFHLPAGVLPWAPSAWWTHGPWAPVTVDLLVGLLLYGVWRALMRTPVLAALPSPWAGAAVAASDDVAPRLASRSQARVLAAVVASVVVGAATHVLLDLVAHEPGGVNPGWSWLMAPAGPLRVYLWLQYLLSALGLAVLAWWCVRWAGGVADVRAFRPTPMLWSLWVAAAAGFGVGAVLRTGDNPFAGIDESVTAWLTTVLIGGVSGATVALLVWAAVVRLRGVRRPVPIAAPAAERR